MKKWSEKCYLQHIFLRKTTTKIINENEIKNKKKELKKRIKKERIIFSMKQKMIIFILTISFSIHKINFYQIHFLFIKIIFLNFYF